jgi:hypothetical protein
VPTYRLYSTAGDDLGVIEHPAPNLEPGDVVQLPDGHDGIVSARVETDDGAIAALLEVVVAPTAPELPESELD